MEDGGLPTDLHLNTQRLLTTLPSSSQLLLLPQSLRRYRPFVDLQSPAATVSSEELTNRIGEWFKKTVSAINEAFTRWVSDLDSMRQLWAVRRSLRRWLTDNSELEETEQREIRSMIDGVCSQHAASIWTKSLASIALMFGRQLSLTLDDPVFFSASIDCMYHDTPYMIFLGGTSEDIASFRVPLAPDSALTSSHKKYKVALRHQVAGRSTLVERVLVAVEGLVRDIRTDLNFIHGEDPETR
jgi:conserved oligomeric Golgi complex subunit 1